MLTMCPATACAAAFSLVQTTMESEGSMATNPTMTDAAARVLPAPKTPALQVRSSSEQGQGKANRRGQQVPVRQLNQRAENMQRRLGMREIIVTIKSGQ